MRIFAVIAGLLVLAIALFAYGQHWPRRWQTRVPSTNMSDVQARVGTPLNVSTNSDGSILWDYTHWWSGTARVYFHSNGDFHRVFTEW
ncbi:MAG: hypothetical protein IPK15_09940 [Verrucomicrobia bacterium]|nr:hypothetical protein [Verrucomicrobiota bacterium]